MPETKNATGPEVLEPRSLASDPRAAAFCSPGHPEVFHGVAYRNDIFKEDPFDVETIHEEARLVFQKLVRQATAHPGASAGRILLLQGESGSGKTHLMRAFRNWAHANRRGYYGYMQMTAGTNHYGRYILNNLIDSLDQPYHEGAGETTGLMRLSTAIAESPRGVGVDRLEEIRGGQLDSLCLARMVDALADQVVMDDRFNTVDLDLVRALIYLQCDDPRIRSRILKYLRCENLSEADRRALGGLIPRCYDDAPQWLIQRFGELMAALEAVPLILCVDQLEDIYSLDDAEVRFRRALAALCDIVSRVPTVVVVISCLENFYETMRNALTKPIRDRIEHDPSPLALKGARDEGEIVSIVARRLDYLYDALGVALGSDDPTYPFPAALLKQRVGMPTREALIACQDYRERCIAAGALVPDPDVIGGIVIVPVSIALEQAWNDYRTSFPGTVPTEDDGLARLLAGAIKACSDETETGHWFEAEADGRLVPVECHARDNSVRRLLVGVCNITARGGHLGRQVAEVEERAGEYTLVLVRSTEFPVNPTAAVTRQIGALIARGGRRVVVEDTDWRTMSAFLSFVDQHKDDPDFAAWRQRSLPLSLLKSLRLILDLDGLKAARPLHGESPRGAAQPEPPQLPPPPTREHVEDPPSPEPAREDVGPLVLGVTDDRAKTPVTLEPADLTRHATFLGGTGSGKTTVALNLVEQLLLRGIPAILVDRKGDLCGYAREESWTRPIADPGLAARRQRLRARVEVAVYTPGNPLGRPLSIALAPPGLGQLGSLERVQVSRYAASALAGMMNYGTGNLDQSRKAILTQAIDLLAQLEPDAPVALETLIEYIHEKDPGLVNAVGKLDTKLFERLVQDLETLRLSRGEFLAAQGEPLDPEMLLGLGRHATPGKTRLSVINTKFLGVTQDIQFWVSQLLIEMSRWASRSPSGRLQAVLMFDEADLYLPAQRQPPSKGPMEDLLRRARSAGLGLLLATQSPGDFDYRCRDNIRAWFVGRVKEQTALTKMKPMLSECRVDIEARLATQETGQFHLLSDGDVTGLRADRSALLAEQIPEDEILVLARNTLDQQATAKAWQLRKVRGMPTSTPS